MTTAWDRRPRLVEDVLGKDGEVRKAGWLDEARLPKWSAKEVRDKCWTLLLRDKEMTQTAFLKECGGENAARYAKFQKAPNKQNGVYYGALVFFAERENAIRAPWSEYELEVAREVARKAAEKREAKEKRAAARLTNKARKEAGKIQQQPQPKSASAAATAATTVVIKGQQMPWSKRKLPDLMGPMRKGARKAAVHRLALSDDD